MSRSLTDARSSPEPRAELSFVLGGARSGKSRFAESLTTARPHPIYLATAAAVDEELEVRIAAHRERRGSTWETVEAPLDLVDALQAHAAPNACVLIDCLTLWLGNLMYHRRNVSVETDRLVHALGQLAGPAVVVSNEVGLGIVPGTPSAREFRDHAGWLNQRVATVAEHVYQVTAGIATVLKSEHLG